MGLCMKCKKMLPPGFVEEEVCIFCKRNTEKIEYSNGKIATKTEIVNEYDIFLKVVKEKNEILKNAVKGDTSGIPDKLILD